MTEMSTSNMCNTQTLPHEAHHWSHICDSCLVSSEYLSPRILVQREPRTKLFDQLIAATGIEYVLIVPTNKHEWTQEHFTNDIIRAHVICSHKTPNWILTVCCNLPSILSSAVPEFYHCKQLVPCSIKDNIRKAYFKRWVYALSREILK